MKKYVAVVACCTVVSGCSEIKKTASYVRESWESAPIVTDHPHLSKEINSKRAPDQQAGMSK